MVLADPDTPKQVINVADQLVCNPLQPRLKKEVSCFRSCLDSGLVYNGGCI